jgi:hypothetical protein
VPASAGRTTNIRLTSPKPTEPLSKPTRKAYRRPA